MIRWMRALTKTAAEAILVVFVLVSGSISTIAAELLMIEEQGCPWCRRWHAEIGVAYPHTPEGQRAPLRRVDIANTSRLGIALAKPVTYSPTFVLVEDGREVGRIVGHPGPDFFWGLLTELLARLPPQEEKPGSPQPHPPGLTKTSSGLAKPELSRHFTLDGPQI